MAIYENPTKEIPLEDYDLIDNHIKNKHNFLVRTTANSIQPENLEAVVSKERAWPSALLLGSGMLIALLTDQLHFQIYYQDLKDKIPISDIHVISTTTTAVALGTIGLAAYLLGKWQEKGEYNLLKSVDEE